ncbi:LytR C-terminal domain-containing protein [Patescibacteria group bacterium]|nr:LytR C-terminal domain-containing protein [Patescibacteria group bacterium]
MKDLLISLNSNTLRVSLCSPQGCAGFFQELPDSVVNDSQILNVEAFTQQLIDLSSSLLPIKHKPDSLSFIVDSQDIILAFLTVTKNEDSSLEEQLTAEAIVKSPVPLEDLYFSYTKIAPFVYQFVGIKKDYLDSLLEVSNLWGVPIKAVVPWALLLPKALEQTSSAIFVGFFNNKHTVVLSELHGVYFAASYEKEKTEEEMLDLVEKLSLYNRTTPIKDIYTVNAAFTIGESYKVHPLLEEESFFGEEGYELHDLVLKATKKMPELLSSHVNVLNLLPLPEAVSRTKILVPIVGALVLVAFGGFFLLRGDVSNSARLVPSGSLSSSPDVLSEVSQAQDSSVEEAQVKEDSEENLTTGGTKGEAPTIADLIIRVENATEVNGAASRTQKLLEEKGYKVESIGTAPNQLELTQVLITAKMMPLKDELKLALGEKIPVEIVDELDELPSNEEYSHNVLIRLGKNSSI